MTPAPWEHVAPLITALTLITAALIYATRRQQ